jgi:hypothetical protein
MRGDTIVVARMWSPGIKKEQILLKGKFFVFQFFDKGG